MRFQRGLYGIRTDLSECVLANTNAPFFHTDQQNIYDFASNKYVYKGEGNYQTLKRILKCCQNTKLKTV